MIESELRSDTPAYQRMSQLTGESVPKGYEHVVVAEVVGISDYNAMRSLLGLEPVSLKDGHYLMRFRKHRHDYLRTREATAGDMARELLHIGHDDGFPARPGSATNTTPEGNVHASYRALEWTEHQLGSFTPSL